MHNDDEHLQIISIFHYVFAVLAFLFSLVMIFQMMFMDTLFLNQDFRAQAEVDSDEILGFMQYFFMFFKFLGIFGVIYSILMVYAGIQLHHRESYNFILVMAAISCLYLPLGTILGIFTISVLTRPSVKDLFQQKVVSY